MGIKKNCESQSITYKNMIDMVIEARKLRSIYLGKMWHTLINSLTARFLRRQ